MARRMWTCCSLLSVLTLSITACSDRGEMYSQQSSGSAPDTAAGRTAVTATGCFQEMTGFDNYVLSNVGDAAGVNPAATRAYRVEQRGDLEQHVGKRVTISGWVDSPAAADGMVAKRAANGELDFNDLPELHVDTVTPLSDACGASGGQ
jgi:hypothetical protein